MIGHCKFRICRDRVLTFAEYRPCRLQQHQSNRSLPSPETFTLPAITMAAITKSFLGSSLRAAVPTQGQVLFRSSLQCYCRSSLFCHVQRWRTQILRIQLLLRVHDYSQLHSIILHRKYGCRSLMLTYTLRRATSRPHAQPSSSMALTEQSSWVRQCLLLCCAATASPERGLLLLSPYIVKLDRRPLPAQVLSARVSPPTT